MRSKLKIAVVVVSVVAMFCGSAFAGKKRAAHHVAFGTIASISDSQVVVNEKVKGKDQPMTFHMDSSTQKSGNLTNGSAVTIEYHTENNQNIATSVRERAADHTAKKSSANATKE